MVPEPSARGRFLLKDLSARSISWATFLPTGHANACARRFLETRGSISWVLGRLTLVSKYLFVGRAVWSSKWSPACNQRRSIDRSPTVFLPTRLPESKWHREAFGFQSGRASVQKWVTSLCGSFLGRLSCESKREVPGFGAAHAESRLCPGALDNVSPRCPGEAFGDGPRQRRLGRRRLATLVRGEKPQACHRCPFWLFC